MFSSCAGPHIAEFDAARNNAGDIAIAIQAKCAQSNCESQMHEDGEFVLVRFD